MKLPISSWLLKTSMIGSLVETRRLI